MNDSFSTAVFQPDIKTLRLGMCETFSKEELRVACFDLEIDYENLPGETKEVKVIELIGYAIRRGRLQDLVAYVQNARPHLQLSQKAMTVVASTAPPGTITPEQQRMKHRRALRDDRRDINLVHTLRPSNSRPGWYDILIYLVPHHHASLEGVKYAEFFLGKYWNNEIYRATNTEGFVGISISAYGPVLCTCCVVFQDKHETYMDRYIDFEMANGPIHRYWPRDGFHHEYEM